MSYLSRFDPKIILISFNVMIFSITSPDISWYCHDNHDDVGVPYSGGKIAYLHYFLSYIGREPPTKRKLSQKIMPEIYIFGYCFFWINFTFLAHFQAWNTRDAVSTKEYVVSVLLGAVSSSFIILWFIIIPYFPCVGIWPSWLKTKILEG